MTREVWRVTPKGVNLDMALGQKEFLRYKYPPGKPVIE